MTFRWLLGVGLLGAAVGCGSDDAAGGNQGGGSGAGGTPSSQAGAGSGGTALGGGGAAGSNAAGLGGGAGSAAGGGAGSSVVGGAAGAGGSAASGSGSGGELSAACQMYCSCHEENCAAQAIPGSMSCGDFCSAMTEEQLACRQNMCGLVPFQPDNDHCKHSVGIDQCL
jgi:hypothetical protein